MIQREEGINQNIPKGRGGWLGKHVERIYLQPSVSWEDDCDWGRNERVGGREKTDDYSPKRQRYNYDVLERGGKRWRIT